MSTKTHAETIKDALANLMRVTSDPAILEALPATGDTEAFDEIYSSLRAVLHDMEQAQVVEADLEFDVSPVYSKHDGRPTFELEGMARNHRKAIEETNGEAVNTGDFLQLLKLNYTKAGEEKHEVVTAYAEALSAKKLADDNVRIAKRAIYGAVSQAIEDGEIKLDTHRTSETGEELSSYVLPAWLPAGIDIQNAQELVYDPVKVMFWAQSLNIWDVVSLDEDKLERFVKNDTALREGKRTAKYAHPVRPPVVILPKFKITVGSEMGYSPDSD